jgi:hypothetical protein
VSDHADYCPSEYYSYPQFEHFQCFDSFAAISKAR